MASGKRLKTARAPARSALMGEIVWTIPRLYHRLTGRTEALYARHGLTAGKRSLLHDLAMQGPRTIAEMVRARPPVTRQYIQRLVSELRQSGFVMLEENPTDRRTKTAHLTAEGERIIATLVPAETSLIADLLGGHSTRALKDTHTVLVEAARRLEQAEANSRRSARES